ncbi:MAG: chemoreceptor glutamine deamidase CheD [Panacagrimonas sp.]
MLGHQDPQPTAWSRSDGQRPANPQSYYDSRFSADALKVLPGEYIVTRRKVMLVTVLGSCVSACIRDPLARVGGMNHFMLPDTRSGSESARYGGYAMEVLINELLKQGASRARLEAKVFGGGAVLRGFTKGNVGQRNADFVLEYLQAENIPLSAQDLCGVHPRRVHYFPLTGQVLVRHLPSANDTDLQASERLYQDRMREAPACGSVELF